MSNRVAAGGGAPVIEGQKRERVPFTPTLQLASMEGVKFSRSERRMKPKWYLMRDNDLAIVTDEESNPALGIVKLTLEAPTVNQKNAGIICKVSMESLTGWDYSITIWESKQNPGDIMLNTTGRKIEKDGKEDWIRDRKLNDPTTAQILSFVWKHLRPVQS